MSLNLSIGSNNNNKTLLSELDDLKKFTEYPYKKINYFSTILNNKNSNYTNEQYLKDLKIYINDEKDSYVSEYLCKYIIKNRL